MKLFKILKGFIALFLVLALVLSCKPREFPKEKELVTITKTVIEIERDTLVKVVADSTFYNALVECRNGKPVLIPKTSKSKTETKAALQPPVVNLDEKGNLNVRCDYFENLYKITLKDKQILEQRLTEKTIVPPPEIVQRELSKWQKTQIWFGRLAFFAILIYLISRLPWKISLGR